MTMPLRAQPKEEKGLSNWVLLSLREAILSGRFEPGEKLDQAVIASELDVSRTPIREALKVLETEGFVEIRSYKGVYLSTITKKEVHDIYEIRWIIESEMVRQATSLISDEALKVMDELLNSLYAQNNQSIEDWYQEIDKQFHGMIASNCTNILLTEILEKLNNRILRVRSFAIRQHSTHVDVSHQEHINILEAMKKRCPEEAARCMETHLKNSAERIEKHLE